MGFYDVRIKKTYFECPRLVIYTINSVFNKRHSLNAEVKYLNTELDTDTDTNPTFMDMLMEIEGCKYHVEFQLAEDKMAIRMYEYGVRETLREISSEEGGDYYELYVEMPEQVVVFLAGHNKKDRVNVVLRLPNRKLVQYSLPCISACEDIDRLIRDKLYIFIPFQQVQFNRAMIDIGKKTEEKKKEMARTLYEYRELVKKKLEKLYADGILTAREKDALINACADVENYLKEKDKFVKQEVSHMGDDVELLSDRLERIGWEKGEKEGRKEGKKEHLKSQIQKKLSRGDSIEKIADDLVEDIEEIKRLCKEIEEAGSNI